MSSFLNPKKLCDTLNTIIEITLLGIKNISMLHKFNLKKERLPLIKHLLMLPVISKKTIGYVCS